METIAQLQKRGQSYIGKKAQCGLLTMISDTGKKILEPAQKITDFEIVRSGGEDQLMLTLGGESVYEDLLINIH